METFDDCEGAEDMEKESSALGVIYFLLLSHSPSFLFISSPDPPPALLSMIPTHVDLA